MTPKEKAIELYNKYEFIYIQNYTSRHEVKECVIIAVDEIINTTLIEHSEKGHLIDEGYAVDYWNEVKKEINAL